MSNSYPFLFEIGTEELPPKSLKNLASVLCQKIIIQLEKKKLIDKSTNSKVYATPRRLAVFVEAVLDKQPDQVIDRRGPTISQAYDDAGQPTQAAIGFAKSVGLEFSELQTKKTDKGEWLFCQITQNGRTAQELIPSCVENALKALPISKRMRWGTLESEFVRPVKWMVMLLGKQLIESEILSTRTDRHTYGHRFHAVRRLRLRQADEYETLLEQEGLVVADFGKRRQQIVDGITQLATEKQAQILFDGALLDEVTGLVELPVPLMGEIDKSFMSLPQEVLISSMQDHQKYFPLIDQQSKLLPFFIMVSNIRSKDESSVIQGNERVLKARLSDAQFFWDTDRQVRLDQRIETLGNILFHQKLGSLADKVNRIGKLAEYLANQLGLEQSSICRSAELCKTDLVTDMVGEFPDLQGVMGKYYALNDGESSAVADAIEQHYWPRFSGDQIPTSDGGKVLAIADKLDTICGIFAAGEVPSGDRDPLGLRRAALGVLRILIEADIDLDLGKAITNALSGFSDAKLNAPCEQEIYTFIFERLKTYYQSQGFDTRLYQAVAAVKPVSPLDFDLRLKAISEFSELDVSQSLIEANKRISNILQKIDKVSDEIDQNIFEQDQEGVLFNQLQSVIERMSPLEKDNNYSDLLKTLAELKQPVDDFFDHVMVMDENPSKRQNRIALLSQLHQLFSKVADISYLG